MGKVVVGGGGVFICLFDCLLYFFFFFFFFFLFFFFFFVLFLAKIVSKPMSVQMKCIIVSDFLCHICVIKFLGPRTFARVIINCILYIKYRRTGYSCSSSSSFSIVSVIKVASFLRFLCNGLCGIEYLAYRTKIRS